MTGPQRDLSALRGGLSGLRQPAPPKPAPVPEQQTTERPPIERPPIESGAAEDTGTPVAETPVTEAPARSQRSGRRPAKAAAPAPAPGKRPIPVYLPAGTKSQLEQLARAADITLTEWVLDRLDEFYDELGEAFRPVPTRRSPLPPRQRLVRPRGEASTTVQLRLTNDEIAAIEKLRAQLEVPSRSALLARVVELGVERGNPG
jgi:hypothetical protein